MALEFAHGAIQWLAADAATTVYTVSGLSFQPKALRFYWQGLGSAVDANSEATHSRRGIGFAASPSDRRCVATQDQDAAGTSVCTSGVFDDAVVSTITSTPARDGALDLNSITSDGFTLIVDDAAPVNITVFWEAWGGDDITAAATARTQEPAAPGAQSITVGFQPSVLMLAGVQVVGTGATVVTREASGLSVGFDIASIRHASVCGNADDASANMDTDGYGATVNSHQMIAQAGGNITANATSTGFNATGFTFSWTNVATTDRNVIFLVIAGGAWAAGEYTIDGATVNATATVSGLPFTPKGILLLGRMTTEQASNVTTVQDRIGLGTGSSTSSRRTMGHLSEDGTANAEIDLTIQYDQVLAFPSTAGGLQSAYDINAMNADGFQIIVDTAGGVASEWQGYLAFGDQPPGRIFKLAGDGGGLAGPMRGLAA